MTTALPTEGSELKLHSIYLAGADVLAAMSGLGLGPAQLNVFSGGRFVSAAIAPMELNNDPTTASPIYAQLQVAPAAVAQNDLVADPEAQQRSQLLALLQKHARLDPVLARDPQFWAAMASARKGMPLSPLQRKSLGGAWTKLARRSASPSRLRSAQAGRSFMQGLTAPSAFRHHSYLMTMVQPPAMSYSARVLLGEDFEGRLFDKLWPAPSPHLLPEAAPEAVAKPQHEKHRALKWSHKRVMLTQNDGEVTAGQFASRPLFNPKLTPDFGDTDSGDDG